MALPVDATLVLSDGAADPIFLQRTSGTTGTPKRLLVRRRAYEGRIVSWTRILDIAEGHHVLIALPFTFASAYWQTAIALRVGATIVFESRIALPEALILHRIDCATLMPLQVRETVDHPPANAVRLPGLTMVTIGGHIARALRSRAMDMVAGRLREVYSANEIGNIAVIETDADPATGSLCPGVRVEIVDGRDQVVPPGQVGRIRARTDYMTDGYLDDPETTARLFKEGWFYPGDVGVLREANQLQVLGREDELLNVGGHKVMPADLEDVIRQRTKVDDVAVCTLPNADGVEEVWVAAVYDGPDERDLKARLAPGFVGYPFGIAHLIKLARIPRTETRKIKRAELRQAVIDAAHARGISKDS